MVGITSFGSYIPFWRLSRELIARAWGRRPPQGEKAVAYHDEDVVTMAVDACLSVMGDGDAENIGGLIFSTTTSPYWEKLSSATIATACDLKKDIFTADLSSSLRAGTSAFRLACENVKSGAAHRVLVASSDGRPGEPESEMEMSFGDGAGCLLVGKENVIAEVEGTYSVTDEFLDMWRRDADRYVRSGEEKFGQVYGYVKNMREACLGVMASAGLTPQDVSKAVLSAPSQSGLLQLARSLGLNAEKQVQDPLIASLGHCGAAQPFLMLQAALEEAAPGQKILWACYGDGADAVVLRATDAIAKHTPSRRLKSLIESKKGIATYEKYLRFKNILEDETSPPKTSSILAFHEVTQDIKLYGSKCDKCGSVQFPQAQVCISCKAKGTLKDVRLSRRGKVFTYTKDFLFVGPDPPQVMAVVDLDGGGRVYLMMTDCDPEAVAVGMPVELCFRRLHEGGGFHNYYWKCRPVRG